MKLDLLKKNRLLLEPYVAKIMNQKFNKSLNLFLTLIISLLILSGCHPSPQVMKEVNRVTLIKKEKPLTCPQDHPMACAIHTPLIQLYEKSLDQKQDHVTLLEKGEESLLLRLHMIKSAQKSINIQTFIWVNDEAGHMVLAQLLEAAKRGVKVNIIIDQLFSMGNSWFLAEVATLHQNLNVKMFNPLFNEGHTSSFDFFSALTCCLYNLNRRMHNKLFLVDDMYGITGGRNYNDRYFDWDSDFNYRDRDVLAVGKVTKEMRGSFDRFWNSKWVVPLENLDDVALRILNDQEISSEWGFNKSLKAKKINLKSFNWNQIKELFVDKAIAVDSIEYWSDSPEKLFVKSKDLNQEYKEMSLKIQSLITSAEDNLLFQTPYLVLSRKAYRALRILKKTKPQVKLTVSTNSLSSTDAYYVYAISYKHKRKYLKKLNLNIFEYKQSPEHQNTMFAQESLNHKTRFGLHSKSIVIDDKVSLIGSHNFDHRSDVLNTESGLIIYSEKVARQLSKYIKEDMLPENSWVVAPRKKVPVFSYLSGLIATVSRSLPTLDLWPFRYSSSFELIEGKKPVDIKDKDFYDNYRNVGSFPEIKISSKQIQTLIISAFLGFAEPFM